MPSVMPSRRMLLVFALWAAAPAVAGAQAKTSGGFDSFLLLVTPRDTVTIKKSLRAATEAGMLAENRRQQAETMRLGARARIEAKKVEIVRIKERASVAKKENRDADRVGLEAERKAAEREIDLLKVREELRQAETELEKQTLEAQRAQAAATAELSDGEIKVIDRRLDLLDAQQRVLSGK